MDETFFRGEYERDAANKARQTWSEYQEWVNTFYQGKRFPPVTGWAGREADLLRAVPPSSQPSAREALGRVGRIIAAEWAKDNGVRKVSTADLQSWGKRFADAARDPHRLLAALREVEDEVRHRTP